MGRPPILGPNGEKLRIYAVRLFDDQVEFLQAMGKGEASQYLRELLSESMRSRARSRARKQANASGKRTSR